MNSKMFVKPANGCHVRDPLTLAPLETEGEEKPVNGFWLRRVRDGSVIKAKQPAAKPEAKTKKTEDVS